MEKENSTNVTNAAGDRVTILDPISTFIRPHAVDNVRGWAMFESKFTPDKWFWADSLKPVKEGIERPCARCGRLPTKDGHDACLGAIPGVTNACCGHGVMDPYAQSIGGGVCTRTEGLYDWPHMSLAVRNSLPKTWGEFNYEISHDILFGKFILIGTGTSFLSKQLVTLLNPIPQVFLKNNEFGDNLLDVFIRDMVAALTPGWQQVPTVRLPTPGEASLILDISAAATGRDEYNFVWTNFPFGKCAYRVYGLVDGSTLVPGVSPSIVPLNFFPVFELGSTPELVQKQINCIEHYTKDVWIPENMWEEK